MPISENIKKTILELEEDEKVKNLLMEILSKEDSGTKQYKKEYEKIINDFIEQEGQR